MPLLSSPKASSPWYKRVYWYHAGTLIIIPFLGFLAIPWVPLNWKTALFSIWYFVHTGICITAGYHRLWSHRSYTASAPLRLYLAIFGTAAMEGPITWWAREHRAHHRYTDTDEDPYNIKKGFWHAHLMWMIMEQPKCIRYVNVSDLKNDSIVMWQSRHFVPLALFMGWGLPALVAGQAWNDWRGGFLYGGIIRMFFDHQSTFSINSVAHYFGDQPYDDRLSPRNNTLASLLTMGEGYHNSHHEFPSDYRNGIKWYDFDTTKWVIYIWEMLGFAWDLRRFWQSEIEKACFQQLQKVVYQKEQEFDWGQPLEKLPVVHWEEYQRRVEHGETLICVEGVLHDMSTFMVEHPGGISLIKTFFGKDATKVFNGGIYNHSKVARNILSTTCVALVK